MRLLYNSKQLSLLVAVAAAAFIVLAFSVIRVWCLLLVVAIVVKLNVAVVGWRCSISLCLLVC